MAPSLTETLFALGVGDAVVAVDAESDFFGFYSIGPLPDGAYLVKADPETSNTVVIAMTIDIPVPARKKCFGE